MTTNNRVVLDTLFVTTAFIALFVLLSIAAVSIGGGIIMGAVAGDALGTPGLIAGFLAMVILFSSLAAVILDQTDD